MPMDPMGNGKSPRFFIHVNQPSLKLLQVLKVSREVEWAPVRDGKGRHAAETARCGKRGGDTLIFLILLGGDD